VRPVCRRAWADRGGDCGSVGDALHDGFGSVLGIEAGWVAQAGGTEGDEDREYGGGVGDVMIIAMTEFELEDAVARNPTNADILKMRLEIERMGDLLSDAWLFIDRMAHDQTVARSINDDARRLLAKQEAPGWKPR